ncbi:hypothetical protein [Croceicoccus mobilis]|uniref:Uncharacterized protein n=1 Tax=Croceicoccus mobilis TaxID=1703339 RepID=A0A917DN79_9SPHN|nr:hypothetical protein [Croceicoccus mobilis]GGD55101.1 hypothetical protein GCM10010990_00280 [Croceicoccus mobilis]
MTLRHTLGAVALAAFALAAPAHAQEVDGNVRAEDIPLQPLRDLNIDQKDIPPLLVDIANHPYSSGGLVTCGDIEQAIADIDALVGPDVDTLNESTDLQKGANSVGRIAGNFVGGLIPFRGIVREISGANAHRRELRAMVAAALIRRGFLKGLGLQRECPWPARPAEVMIDFDDEDAARAAPPPEKTAGTEVEAPAPDPVPAPASAPPPEEKRFVSQPVVQGED